MMYFPGRLRCDQVRKESGSNPEASRKTCGTGMALETRKGCLKVEMVQSHVK
jgi:hypothetical protein